jgi:tRNA uridine 5-carboxymethylaminomethyl modification enzyme
VHPNTAAGERANQYLKQPLGRDHTLAELLRRPEIVYAHIADIAEYRADDAVVADQVEIEIKYEGYISRQADEIERLRKNENTALPVDLDYGIIGGLSNEIKQKLGAVRPETVAQASRVQGVTPAAISQILVYMKKRELLRKQSA